jgi:ribonuclease P/MRP protein subunit RPP1
MLEGKFYDLNVHAFPEGAATVSRMALAARDNGFSGICISYHDPFFSAVEEKELFGIQLYKGVEVVVPRLNDLRKMVDRYRNKVDVLTVHGGEEALNRAACEDDRVDVLAHPQDGKTSGINHIVAKMAADRFIAIEFDLSPIITGKGGNRVKALSWYRTNLTLVKKYGTPYVITAGTLSQYDMRDIRALISLCALFGMDEEDAIKGLSYYPSEILRRNLPGTGFIMEGVELILDH